MFGVVVSGEQQKVEPQVAAEFKKGVYLAFQKGVEYVVPGIFTSALESSWSDSALGGVNVN